MQSCSKGARGLSVWPRVYCILTAISISLSLGWRQCGPRYAIRAGRNLPAIKHKVMGNTTAATRETGTDYRSGAFVCARFVVGFDLLAKFFCWFFVLCFVGHCFICCSFSLCHCIVLASVYVF